MDERFAIAQELESKGFDDYIPMYLSNGDLGGTFDPFGGTWYDELRSGGGAGRDIRTLYLAGICALDYWQKQVFSPENYGMTEETRKHILDNRSKGIGDVTSAVRGTPFSVRLFCDRPGFPDQVHSQRQVLDTRQALLKSDFSMGENHYTVTNFIHALESALVYR